jgi:uncharacterized protein
MTFRVGESVRVEMTKWGERPHWEFDGMWLGSDQHGDWIGYPTGTSMSRPGAAVLSPNDQVGLVPSPDLPDEERWWIGTFHGPGGPGVSVYVDIATPPTWDGNAVHTVDLDLDVIRGVTGRIWVDDEDEFAQHRVALGYPDDLVGSAMRSCDRVLAAVTSGRPPYDGSHRPWLQLLTEMVGHERPQV